MDADKSVTAVFTALCYTLDLVIDPVGGGQVQLFPEPNCGDDFYTPGTQVQLTAQPASGYIFERWGGDTESTNNPIVITMSKSQLVAAYFAPKPVWEVFLPIVVRNQ